MNSLLFRQTLISQSRRFYWRYYRLVVLATILMMAVLAGSLLLGDSVRGTLVQRVTERLGSTETLIASGTGFLDEGIMKHQQLATSKGCLLVDGFVSDNGRLLPVYVWGMDADSLSYGDALVNEPLRQQLGDVQDIVLHLPSHNLVPSGSLFVTQSYATQMRLHIAGQKSVEQGGNLLLKNEQTLPLNVFVNRQQLAEVMELEGKINLILSDEVISEDQLAAIWTPELSGIQLADSSLTYDGIFIPQEVVQKVLHDAGSAGTSLYFSYLVNDIICHTDTVPYSFVTAVTEWQGEPLTGCDILLSDYAADRLHVGEGDSVRMSYFLARDLKNLDTREQTFRVKHVIPLEAFMRDTLLMAEFPGLSNVERCADWDSDLPIRMDRVHKADEEFWYSYRQTPKAVVAYDAVCDDWAGTFGSATAMRFSPSPLSPSTGSSPTHQRLNSLSFGDLGILLVHPREQGLQAASSGVDFASLFLALGFFIILSAILLMATPLQEMFTRRRNECLLYTQLGFRQRDVRNLLFRESIGVMLLASPFGVLAGVLYSGVTLWLLGNVWSGATHTEGFALHIHPLTLIVGWVVGVLICLLTLGWTIRRVFRDKGVKEVKEVKEMKGVGKDASSHSLRRVVFAGFLVLTLGLIVANFLVLHSMMLFIVAGLLWTVTWGLFLHLFICQRAGRKQGFSHRQLVWQSVSASLRQHMLAYWTLSLGVFTVFAVGLNRPDFSDAAQFQQATGGYQLYVESRVPIQYDLNNNAVRQKLALTGLPDSTRFLHFLRHVQDEASCLNLNKVSTPTVLGVDLKAMEAFGLSVPKQDKTVAPSPSARDLTPSPAKLYLDEEALLWSLMKSVGDTLTYQDGRGAEVPVVIGGSYPTGIFHGSAIMAVDDFRRLWPKEGGVEVLLLESSNPDEAAYLLSTALSEYGLNIQTTEQRIRMFFEVTETYLIIFLTLGGLGLLLGIFSLVVIVRKNLTAQRPTIRQYRAMGFSESRIRQLLLHENLLVPLYAVSAGAVGAVISISANVAGAGRTTILVSVIGFLLFCLFIYYGIKQIIKQTI